MKTLYPKKHYMVYIKSHAYGFSDYEDECEATSRLQATRIFLKRLDSHIYIDTAREKTYSAGDGWDEKSLYPYVELEDEIGGGLHG